MEDSLASIISNYHDMLLLEETMRELELTKNINTELITLINIANRERDEAKQQLQILLNKNKNNNLVMFQTPTNVNTSITTESNGMSHVSSPVDTQLFETVSSSSSSHHHHQELNNALVDVESARIESLANGKILPQKGKLLQAVTNCGPILKNLMVSGPTPTWENPPPLCSYDHLNNNSFPGGVRSNNNTCLFTSNSSSILKRKRLL